ncbi:hypothetical protein BaRGS_00008135 [Batillaria attramentaria]|uniref:Uncharacterized protein n=1 Tax=Batillaria attramentaria TaxID=370345 RepID=A0ABD0LM93_9CAEN
MKTKRRKTGPPTSKSMSQSRRSEHQSVLMKADTGIGGVFLIFTMVVPYIRRVADQSCLRHESQTVTDMKTVYTRSSYGF